MSINEVKRMIESQAKRKGYVLEERKSTTTGSWYFKIYASKDVSLLFRVSDHKTDNDVITLRLDHKVTTQSAQRFVDNRFHDLTYRHTKYLLGM